MDARSHLHEAERLLCSMRPSRGYLVGSCVRGLIDGAVGAVILSLLGAGIGWFAWEVVPSPWLLPLPFALVTGLSWYVRWSTWASATFRVTTERILLEYPTSAFGCTLVTVKWAQYQESSTGNAGLLDALAGAKALCIRYGTADAEREACFPSLRHAKDLKHYLDKVDSAVRKGEIAALRPFVAKPKGQRD